MWLLWRRGTQKMTGSIYSSSSCVKPAFVIDTGRCPITTHSALRNGNLVLRPCHPYWGTRRHHFFIQEGAKGYDPIRSSFPRSPGAGPPNCRGFGGDEPASAGNTTLQALRGCTAEPKCIPRLSSSWRWGGGGLRPLTHHRPGLGC